MGQFSPIALAADFLPGGGTLKNRGVFGKASRCGGSTEPPPKGRKKRLGESAERDVRNHRRSSGNFLTLIVTWSWRVIGEES